ATLGGFAIVGAGAAIATGIIASKLPSNLVANGGDDSPTNGNGPGAFGGRSNVWLHQLPVYNRIKSMADATMVLTYKATDPTRTLIVDPQATSNDAQLWRIDDWGDNGFTIVNKAASVALQAGGNKDPITLVAWTPGLAGDHARWDLGGDEGLDYHALRPEWDSGQNADVWGGGAATGQAVHTGGWNGGTNQKWRFVPDGGFLFNIRPRANPGFALAGGSDGRLTMKQCTPDQAKSDASVQWSLVARGGLNFALVNKASGRAARAGGNRDPVLLVDQTRIDDHAEWDLGGQEGGDGYFYAVRPRWDSGQNWDAWGGAINPGTELHTGGWNGGDNQKWGFFPAGTNDSAIPVF
ncbi:MAG: RICIN domain-containing protein, partial [Acetobacteraceae bacterium]